jgi:hypothetical protein
MGRKRPGGIPTKAGKQISRQSRDESNQRDCFVAKNAPRNDALLQLLGVNLTGMGFKGEKNRGFL